MSDTFPVKTGSPDGAVNQIGAASFKSRCLQIMDRVSETGEEVIITKHGRPVVKLVPMNSRQEREPILGACKESLVIFDEEGLIPSTMGEWAEWEAMLEDVPDATRP